jgi:hypothetical protein
VRLAPDIKDWPADALDDYEERAAIMEYHGNMSREDAEREAEALIRRRYEGEG